MSIHDGHRSRLRGQLAAAGIDTLSDEQVLELALFYALPRRDTAPIARALMERFGSLADVLDAPERELCQVEGVTPNAALLLRLIPQLARRHQLNREHQTRYLNTTEAWGDLLSAYLQGETEEVSYLISLDGKFMFLRCALLQRGTVNAANISIRKAVKLALDANATMAVIAHNHPSGFAVPSDMDRETTKSLYDALKAVGVVLLDHIVYADGDYVSLADDGFFRALKQQEGREKRK